MLIERARVEAQNHWFTHYRQMPVESIAQSVFNLATPTLTDPLCLDLSESLCFSLDAIRIMDLNCSIWTLPALMSGMTLKRLVPDPRELNRVCKKCSTRE